MWTQSVTNQIRAVMVGKLFDAVDKQKASTSTDLPVFDSFSPVLTSSLPITRRRRIPLDTRRYQRLYLKFSFTAGLEPKTVHNPKVNGKRNRSHYRLGQTVVRLCEGCQTPSNFATNLEKNVVLATVHFGMSTPDRY